MALGLLALLALGVLGLILLLRFALRADGDLTLLWSEWRGKRPENSHAAGRISVERGFRNIGGGTNNPFISPTYSWS
uniref:Uncharacterized protein n=1 Tax=Sphaerodactylus townsendi TaxID=933632 RepID=A0ACB8G617_9SAUR